MSDLPEPPPPPGPSAPPPPPPGLTPPPGYVGYGAPGVPGAYRPTQRVGGLAKALTVLLAAAAATSIAALAAQAALASKAADFLDGGLSQREFEDSYDSLISLTLLPSALSIALAVVTIVWMFRLARNLQQLGRAGATWAPGWAIGGWFLPPCGVYAIPWLMLRELWKGSDPAAPIGDPGWKAAPVPAVVNVWWVLFGLVPVITLVGSLSSLTDISQDVDVVDLAESLDGSVPLAAVDALAKVGAAIAFIVIVRRLTTNHRRLTGEA